MLCTQLGKRACLTDTTLRTSFKNRLLALASHDKTGLLSRLALKTDSCGNDEVENDKCV
jgi:hypothetical protein